MTDKSIRSPGKTSKINS